MKRLMPFAIILGVLAVAVGAFLYMSSSPTSNPNGNKNALGNVTPNARKGEPGADPPHMRNNSDKRIVVEEFGDFQCPRCAVVYGELKKAENEFGDKITVIFRQMPLRMHNFAYDAARASEAAGIQGKFWEMHDMLYEKQKDWSVLPDAKQEFYKYAQQLGLEVGRFQNDMANSPIVNSRVALDLRRAESLGVSGTPTIYVNGRMVRVEEMTAEGLRKYINEAISQAGNK